MLNNDQTKIIQARLSRKKPKIKLEYQEIKDYVVSKYGDVEELAPEQLDEVTEDLFKKHEPTSIKVPQNNLPVVQQTGAITPEQKQEIETVARELDIALPLEAIRSIAGTVSWVLTDREQIRSEIRKWVNNKLAQDSRSSEELFDNLETEFSQKLEENNHFFNTRASQFRKLVVAREDEFRSTQAAILGLLQ